MVNIYQMALLYVCGGMLGVLALFSLMALAREPMRRLALRLRKAGRFNSFLALLAVAIMVVYGGTKPPLTIPHDFALTLGEGVDRVSLTIDEYDYEATSSTNYYVYAGQTITLNEISYANGYTAGATTITGLTGENPYMVTNGDYCSIEFTAQRTGPVIRNVSAKQRYPWNGKVDITYEVVGELAEGLILQVTATDRTTGTNYVASTSALSGDTNTLAGAHHVIWDMEAQGLSLKSTNVVFSVAYCPLYCVVDLSGGVYATSYPVTYLNDVLSGGWTDEYKTTKLVLRLIEPGEIPTRDARITKPFYCGVFEVTQKQYELVTGGNPSAYQGDMRPVEQVSYNMIRGSSNGSQWPSSAAVDADSFMGRIQARTGLNFDLPTEAQWEYACRAGTTSAYNNGGDTEDDLKLLGRYYYDRSDGKGGYSDNHTTVGSYLPNAWGLYDMHGNVWELCLDWYGSSLWGDDPVGSSSGSYRVKRGGSWYYSAVSCTSSYRDDYYPSLAYYDCGFRLVRTLSNTEGERSPEAVAGAERAEICSGESTAVAVDSTVSEGLAQDAVTLTWNASWIGGDAGAIVVIADNGAEIKRTTGTGEFTYTPSPIGRHELTYTTYIGGVIQGETYSATVYIAPEILNVSAKQRYPWNGKVDITYEVEGELAEGLILQVTATDRTTGTNYVASTSALSGDTNTLAGAHHVIWDMDAQGLSLRSTNVVFTVAYVVPKYCVIDLSGGVYATSYPVTYLNDVPSGGWTDEYKTTKLVLRLIEPGEIPTRDARITKPFYCGVFEITQKQYELVTGNNPSQYKGDMRPVEKVSYNMIRGSSNGSQWPSSAAVDADSFMGRIQARTGLNFDLPTEAQWEYACRAGTTSTYNNGGYTEDDLKLLGRYRGDQSDGKGGYSDAHHTTVGSYLPNAWGLYDMHGNVWERCLDWYGGSLSGDDPVGSSSGSNRVQRGGCWSSYAGSCTSSSRNGSYPSFALSGIGFRLVRTMSGTEGERAEICSGDSAPVAIPPQFGVSADGVETVYFYGDTATFTAPEPREANGMQVVTLGTTYTAPVITNQFALTVTEDISFAWDILATNWWFETSETQNGSIVASDTGWIADGETLTLTPQPVEHYHFVGWTGDTEGCSETNGMLIVTMDRPRTVGAEFAIDTFTVTFEAGAHGALSGATEQTIDYGATATVPGVTPDAGYTSTGWSGDVSAPVVGDATFTAQYAAIPYAITYTGLKGATNPNPATYTIEDAITFAAPGDVYGWVFTGWTPESIALGSMGDMEVTANWERQKFDVTVNGETRQYSYEDEVTFTAPEPTVDELCRTQIVYVGTTFTAPVVTNEFTVTVTNGFEFTWDILATNWWFETSETLNGSIVASDTGWIADGETLTLTPQPVEHYHFVGWMGDTEGCEATGAQLAVVMDRARSIAAEFEIDSYSVKIGETLCDTVPAAGELNMAWGSMVTVEVANAVMASGATQYVCKGWTATNADPTAGEGARAEFRVLGEVTLDWQWETNVVTLAQAVNAEGLEWTTDGAAKWQPEWADDASDGLHQARCGTIPNGTNAWIATTVEGPGSLTFSWRSALASYNMKYQVVVDGEVKGMIIGTNGWRDVSIAVLGDRRHEIKWRLMSGRSGAVPGDWVALDGVIWTPTVPPTLAEALNTNLVWTTEGDVKWHGVARESLMDEREAWAVVEGLGDSETSVVQTRVYGSGVLMFDWAISCEEDYDWMTVVVDGEMVDYVTGERGWTTTAISIEGEGWHTVAWRYFKDEMDDPELVGENVAKLDNVVWRSEDVPPAVSETQTTPVPVPYAELETKYASYLEQAKGDYEAAAKMTGKNGNAIWESYVAGLDPDKEDSKFRTKIEMLPDGTPKVTWEPDTAELRATRTYTTYGKKTLLDRDWTPVTDADRNQYRFFKVEVDMK